MVEHFYKSAQIWVPKDANGWVAVNVGDTPFEINNFKLNPNPNFAATGLAGESTGVMGNLGEIFVGDNGAIRLNMLSPIGVSPHIVISWKIYIC
jgi:hypothetical protein